MSVKLPPIGRRSFTGSAGAALLGAAAGGRLAFSSRPAAAQGTPDLLSLSEQEARVLERFAETLIPGAASAGIAAYVDYFLARPVAETLLAIRYLPVDPPFLDFYRSGLAALNTLGFASLRDTAATALARRLLAGEASDWQGPPQRLFALAVRLDAVDVTYGTPAGFDRLSIPYLPHIFPDTPWREGGHD